MVLMLLVVTRVGGVAMGGIYSLATAIGQQFQTVGTYEVRPFQATDVNKRHSFGTYYATRIITVILMAVAIVVYTLFIGRVTDGVVVVLLVASLRIFDAFEDVFYGEFQRLGRLDIAGRANFFRVLVTMSVFTVTLWITTDLLFATSLTILASTVALVVLIVPPARQMFNLRPSFAFGPMRSLLVACFPLFAGGFLAMYLANAPRFAIEKFMDADYQGYYAILFMPALAINILAMFIFRPLLTRMATRWATSDVEGFSKLIVRGLQGVLGAFVLTGAVVYFVGIPILNLLYAVDLHGFRGELLVLVAGGAFNSVAIILYYGLTTMRKQHALLVGYVIAALLVWCLSEVLVPRLGIMGASLAYGASMFVLALFFGVILYTHLVRQKRVLSGGK